MDDLKFGTRNKRGDWAPGARLEIAPYWDRPFNLRKVVSWIPEYLFPWNAFHMATALLWWFFVVPDVEAMKTLGWGWALWLYAVNAAAIFVFYGTFEVIYYVRRKQQTRFKYNARFPGDHPLTCSGSKARTSTISCAASSSPYRCGPRSRSSCCGSSPTAGRLG